MHSEALSAPHLLTAVRHQRLVPPTGGVAAQSSSISQQKGTSTAYARGNTPSLRTLCSENPPTHESRFGLSESTNAGKVFCVESVLTQRIIIRTSNFDIRTYNFEHLFQWRRYLISLCHARAHALPTQNSNYQFLKWIDQNPKHLKVPQR